MIGSYMRNYDGMQVPDLRPEFYMDTVRNERATQEAGRDIFCEVERVRVIIPGAIATVLVKNVTDIERQRWPEHYAAFRAGRAAPVDGLPLEEWPVLNKSQVAELRYMKLRTVEDLARLPDVQLGNIMGGQMLRQRARAYLDDALYEAQTTKLLARNEVLESEVAVLRNQVEELGRQLMMLSHQQRREADRPPAFQTYRPGDFDPAEHARERQPFQGTLVNPEPVESALAEMMDRPVRAPRGLIRYDEDGANEAPAQLGFGDPAS